MANNDICLLVAARFDKALKARKNGGKFFDRHGIPEDGRAKTLLAQAIREQGHRDGRAAHSMNQHG